MQAAAFWNDNKKAQSIIGQINRLKSDIIPWKDLKEKATELSELLELASEEKEESFLTEIQTGNEELKKSLEELELKSLLGNEYDQNNAILTLHAGAGGTESCDWTNMLLRLYQRWGERKGYQLQILDILPGEEAGIKSVTVLFKGENAYGFLKAERGVHRLVRISPFDASRRRHTSFASADIIPEVEEELKIEIKEADLRIDTYRASGAGGQHVNVTDSAVRITHLPTGIVAQCQNERSQYQNRTIAMKLLGARLFEQERKKQEEELSKKRGENKEIAWGSQIRSYTFHPYSLVKDHRTNLEIGNVKAVMDGDIDSFISAYLKKFRTREGQE